MSNSRGRRPEVSMTVEVAATHRPPARTCPLSEGVRARFPTCDHRRVTEFRAQRVAVSAESFTRIGREPLDRSLEIGIAGTLIKFSQMACLGQPRRCSQLVSRRSKDKLRLAPPTHYASVYGRAPSHSLDDVLTTEPPCVPRARACSSARRTLSSPCPTPRSGRSGPRTLATAAGVRPRSAIW